MKFLLNFAKKYPVYIVIFILIIPTFYQLLRPGFFPMQDDLQAFRTQQMFKCLVDLQIPCRWIPDMGYQYGYPQFIFYPPSVYYLGATFHLLGLQVIDSVKLMFILGFVLSTLFMFWFLKTFFDSESKEKTFEYTTLPAFVGAMLYTYIPYKALEVFVRGALNEFWSMVFFPLIFLFSYQIIVKKSNKYIALLAVSIGGLLLTHNLMSLIFAPVATMWCLTLLMLKNNWRSIFKLFGGVVLGVGLAAFFTLPIMFEGKYVHLESLVGGYFDYRQHFVNVNRLFVSNHFGYGSSGLNQDNDLTLSTGQIQWTFAIVTFFLAIFFLRKQRKFAILTIILCLSELLVLFMIHQKSSFIWEKLFFLSWLQFPWRFLTDSIFLLALISALGIFFISLLNKTAAKVIAVILVVGVFVLHGSFFTPKEWLNISDVDKFSGQLWQKQLTISIFDYLPIYSILPPINPAPDVPEVLEGSVQFSDYKKGSNYQTGTINAQEESLIRLPLYDFPGMQVRIDGKVVKHAHDDCRDQPFCYGLINLKVPSGEHTINAKLTDTMVRTVGNVVSLGSILIVVLLFWRFRNHDQIK